MLRTLKSFGQYDLVAADGAIGSVDDFYFDDEQWTVRYVVVDTGKWLPGRKVLISPVAIHHVDWAAQHVALSLTREQVKNSPTIDTHKPVSRQQEAAYLAYYGYQPYWGGPALWGSAMYASPITPTEAVEIDKHLEAERDRAIAQGDEHLRSTSEVTGYHLEAIDGQLGHIDDFLVEDDSWAIRYLVIDTSNWWGGKHILVAPEWVTDLRWDDRHIAVELNRQSVKRAPEYDRTAHIDRQWEADYYAHYGRPGYWMTPEGARVIRASRKGPAAP